MSLPLWFCQEPKWWPSLGWCGKSMAWDWPGFSASFKIAVRLDDHRERRELLSGPGGKCLCPDRVVGSGFEGRWARLVGDRDHAAGWCAWQRGLRNAQEQLVAKPNGVEEDGGKIIENGLLSIPRLKEHSSFSLRTRGASSSACEVMCNRWMVWKLPEGHLQCLGLSFTRHRHEANKEKANSIDQDLGAFNVNWCSVKGRRHEHFSEQVKELISRATVVLVGLGFCKKPFEGGWFLIPNLSAPSTRDNGRFFRHILSAVLAAVA